MEVVLETIFSFSGDYNFTNRQVCREFRELAPKVDSLEYLNQAIHDGYKPENFTPTSELADAALDRGLLSLLESCNDFVPEDICEKAAGKGYLHILKWARVQRYPWDYKVCSEAAYNGHLKVLQWLKDNNCPWSAYTFLSAVAGGHLDILQWCKEQDCPVDGNNCRIAACFGQLDVLKWCVEQGYPIDVNAYRDASIKKHKHIIQWLEEIGIERPDM
ncbi:Ankyrin repeat-containing domain [Cedratvirus A11]|uniref:Ankyrin repeat-containing domain n=1 Tax=Cedratvirus A11 TaxID=1903266 RepID=A0A1M7XUT6_9VIRU|nr:Ankyrin repeat-containing domain [Cedratvirus A11]SHO33417.1 Ankyrin repeat-containing domain [Cedratvirus A11]